MTNPTHNEDDILRALLNRESIKGASDTPINQAAHKVLAQTDSANRNVDTKNEEEKQRRDEFSQYLLTEFNELGSFWRHSDSRLENGLGLYFTASGITISAVAFISQRFTSIESFLLFCLPIAIILFVGGVIFATRIHFVSLQKKEFLFAKQLIRKYFVDEHPSKRKYVFLPIATDDRNPYKNPSNTNYP